LEADTFPRFKEKNRQNIQYHFIEDSSEVFHRTRYINLLLKMVQTPIVGVWDTDVIIPLNQIEESIREIKEGRTAFSSPYGGCSYFVPSAISESFRRQADLDILKSAQQGLREAFGVYSVGGAFLVNSMVYKECGGENEHFYGWGAEDLERVKRMEAFGHILHRVEGPLFHLHHPRENSQYVNVEAQVKSLQELLHIANLSQKEIGEYVKTWGRMLSSKKDEMLLRIARHLILNAGFLTDLGLYHGKMGIVLFFAHYARYTGETIYDEFAGELLDEIFEEIHDEIPINFESGLCGIGWGVEYLLENGFMEGDSDEILADIDQKIMERDVKNMKDQSVRKGLQGVFYYVDKRLKSKNRKKDILPFNKSYIDGWGNGRFITKDDNSILLDVMKIPDDECDISEWKLGLEEGCAGYALSVI
jgi:hypothetical protein